MTPRTRTARAARYDVGDFLDGDGVASFVFGGGGPCASYAEAGTAWEKMRGQVWAVWAAERVGSMRGPHLSPPVAAVTHDGLSNEAARCGYPVAGTAEYALHAVDADLGALTAFERDRPGAAASVAMPLDVYRTQLVWLADVAHSTRDDRQAAEQLLYGASPTPKEDTE